MMSLNVSLDPVFPFTYCLYPLFLSHFNSKSCTVNPHAVFTAYIPAIPQPIVSAGFHPLKQCVAIQPKTSIWPHSKVNFSLFLKFNMHLNHLGIFKKMHIQIK